MAKRKKILFIVSRLPVNTETGDRVRVYHFIKKLTERGHQVDLIGFVPAGGYPLRTDIFDLCQNCIKIEKEELEFKNPNRLQQLENFFTSFFQGYPYRVWQWHDEKMMNQARKLMMNNNYDVIHFSEISMAIVCKYLKEKNDDARFVFDFYDSISLTLKNALKRDWSLLWPFRFIEFFRLKRFEKQIAKQVDKAIFISERDRNFLDCEGVVIPNGISKNDISERKRDIDLLFVGNMSFEPNIDAVRWFTKRILPLVVSQKPDLTFYVVGINPPESIRDLDNENVNVMGFVENVNEYYRRAKLFVCPMRLGAGQKNKILEAMINRAPVISTSEGNIGVDAPPEAIALADTPEAFVEKILTLIADKKSRIQLGGNGYKFINTNFSWNKSVIHLEQCYGI